jgi:hypothetical protein
MAENADQMNEVEQSTSSRQASGGKRSDRMLGALSLVFGLWYIFDTTNFAVTSFGTGPVGPKTLPRILGVAFVALAIGLLIKPDTSPEWGSKGVWGRMGAVVATSFMFGQVIESVGFILSSATLAVIIGLFFGGPIKKLVPLSFVFTVVVAFVFNNWLELHLPIGWWGGF